MVEADDDRDPVEQLVEEFTERLRQGRPTSIGEYVKAYPQHADAIRELFPTVYAMEKLRWRENADRRSSQIQAPAQDAGKKLGDFRVVREIGRGGMGIVYEAEQLSLKRRVALKVLPRGIASSDKQRRRFRREAESAARLHHTNIVPIFGIGKQDRLFFYVMQYIEGVGLDQIVAELKRMSHEARFSATAETSVAGQEKTEESSRAAILASALRDGSFEGRRKGDNSVDPHKLADDLTADISDDPGKKCDVSFTIKLPDADENDPSDAGEQSAGRRVNRRRREAVQSWGHHYWRSVARLGVQLADALQYAHGHGVLHRDIKPSNLLLDQSGVVWITDFGLAKHEDYDDLTRTGDVLGTLRYMAPEQLHGQADARSDIHSLGLTLYELLALRPAFDNTHHGPLVQRKTESGVTALNDLNSSIPRDLETIVLKCCATSPEMRYQKADDLAGDLQRFLEDRPIMARRTTLFGRFWHWSRRNPAIAALGGVAVALLLILAIVLGIGNHRTNQALARADHARRRAESSAKQARDEYRRAEDNLNLAVQAFQELIEKIAARGVPDSLDFELDDENGAQQRATVTDADAELLQTLLSFFNQFAIQNRTTLNAETATAWRHIGHIRHRLGQFEKAEEAYVEAIRIHGELSKSNPNPSKKAVLTACIYNDLGVVARKRGDATAASEAHNKARQLLEESRKDSEDSATSLELARTFNLLSYAAYRTGMTDILEMRFRNSRKDHRRMPGPMSTRLDIQREKAENYRKKSQELLETLSRQDPSNSACRLELAECVRARARLAWSAEEYDEAEKKLQSAIDILQQLVDDHPDRCRFKFELAGALRLADLTSQVSKERYRSRIEQSVAIAEELVTAYPKATQYQALLADCLTEHASIKYAAGEKEAAEKAYTRANKLLMPVLDRFGDVPAYRFTHVQTLHGLGMLKYEQKKYTEARDILARAIDSVQEYDDKKVHMRWIHVTLGPLNRSLAKVSSALGDQDSARRALRRAGNMHKGIGPMPRRGLGLGPGRMLERGIGKSED